MPNMINHMRFTPMPEGISELLGKLINSK